MHPLPSGVKYPVRPSIVIAGAVSMSFPIPLPSLLTPFQAGEKVSDREFNIDVKNYVAGSQRIARHVCKFIAKGHRYVDKIPLPSIGKLVSVSGVILETTTR